jgi:hypothetical protein
MSFCPRRIFQRLIRLCWRGLCQRAARRILCNDRSRFERLPTRAQFVFNLGFPVKCLHWIIVIVGIGLISLRPIVPQIDAPETAYNESDSPVDLATPVVVGINLTMPGEKLRLIPAEERVSCKPGITRREVSLKPGMSDSHSWLTLLCKFLC